MMLPRLRCVANTWAPVVPVTSAARWTALRIQRWSATVPSTSVLPSAAVATPPSITSQTVASPSVPPAAPRATSLFGLYAELAKARLSSLVVFTSGAGYLLYGPPASALAALAAVSGTALAAAAAAAANQVWEADRDALMMRTRGRPLPAGSLTPAAALTFVGAATAGAGGVLLVGANPLAAGLALGNIALYVLAYTPLKPITRWNTAVGALVGAIPPLIGWAAAAGSLWAPEPWLLASALFWWQFPHYHSLSWTLRRDYARGGYAMEAVLDATGGKRTAWLVLRSAGVLALLPVATTALGVTSAMFAIEATALNAYFLSLALRFYRDPGDTRARAVFRASLWYLPLLMVAFVFHSRAWAALEDERVDDVAAAVSERADAAPEVDSTLGRALAAAAARARVVGRALCMHENSVAVHAMSLKAALAAALGSPSEPSVGSAVAAPSCPRTASADPLASMAGAGSCPVVVGREVGERGLASAAAAAAAVHVDVRSATLGGGDPLGRDPGSALTYTKAP